MGNLTKTTYYSRSTHLRPFHPILSGTDDNSDTPLRDNEIIIGEGGGKGGLFTIARSRDTYESTERFLTLFMPFPMMPAQRRERDERIIRSVLETRVTREFSAVRRHLQPSRAHSSGDLDTILVDEGNGAVSFVVNEHHLPDRRFH